MNILRCWLRVRPHSRKSKRIAFWLTSVFLFIMVMTFNDVTIQMVQDRVNGIAIKGSRNIEMVNNNRQPKAVINEETKLANPEFVEEFDPSSDLLPDLAPSTLHYLWCGKRRYEFKHYLALKSAVRVIKPDKVYFHYEVLPETDREGYYQWFDKSMEISHLILHKLNVSSCHREGPQRFLLVMKLLNTYGGVYSPEDAVLIDFPVHLRSRPLVTGINARTPTDFQEGIMVGKRLSFKVPDSPEEMQVIMSRGRAEQGGLRPCSTEDQYNRDTSREVMCVNVDRKLFPKDIWFGNTRFAKLSCIVMYDSIQIEANHGRRSSIPRIAHYISLADPYIKFTGYLSLLSSIYVAGFQKVFVHGPVRPQGIWWNKLSNDSRFVYVYREFPETERGEEMSVHMANCVMRVDILLKYGGVYSDYNVLWTQMIPSDLLRYSAVVSPDWHMHGEWPESINHGVLMAKRNSGYLINLRQLFQKNVDKPSWFVDHYLSYRVLELNPRLANINSHLQVKCLNHNCHPSWQTDYRSKQMQNKPGRAFNWQNDTLSLHWVDNFPELNPDMIKYTSGVVVDVARAILKSADIPVIEL